MRYKFTAEQIFADTDLENDRTAFLEALDRHHSWLKQQAESVLGTRVYQVLPCGDIINPVKFHEESDIVVSFHLGTEGSICLESTRMLQEYFQEINLESIGTIVPIVYN